VCVCVCVGLTCVVRCYDHVTTEHPWLFSEHKVFCFFLLKKYGCVFVRMYFFLKNCFSEAVVQYSQDPVYFQCE